MENSNNFSLGLFIWQFVSIALIFIVPYFLFKINKYLNLNIKYLKQKLKEETDS